MVSPRAALLLVGWVSVVACQSNTIQLDDVGHGSGGSDESTSVLATRGDGDESGLPTITTSATTGPVPTTVTTTETGWTPGFEDEWWHLALDTGEPGLPFQFAVWAEQASPGIWNLTFQSLALDIGSTTTPRYLVGEAHTFAGLELGEGQPLQFYTGLLTIPGEANPVNGTDVTIDAFFDGVNAGDPYCGDVQGSVIEPVQADLTGSTFATTRIPDPELLPEVFPTTCP